MTTLSCTGCGAALPPRRLACPACGDLLASVAGRIAPTRAAPAVPIGGRTGDESPPDPRPDPGPDLLPDPAAPEELVSVPVLVPAAAPMEPTGAYPPGSPFAGTAGLPAIAPDAPAAVHDGVTGWPPPPSPSAPRWGEHQAAVSARWASVAAPVAIPGGGAPSISGSGPTASAGTATASRRAAAMPPVPLVLIEQMVAAAAGVIAVAFLLPWADLMIGAAVVGYPWQQLGVLGSWHWLAWLGALPVILLAVAAPDLATWLRLGVVPIAYAGLVIGLTWPYVLGPIGGAIAPLVIVAAAMVLIVLGAIAVRPGGLAYAAPET